MPTRQLAITICLVLAVRFACASDQASEVDSSPARLIDAEKSLVSHVEFPAGMGETRFIVRCSILVMTSGHLSYSVCFDAIGEGAATLAHSDLVRLTRGISTTIAKERALPARIDGRERRVRMNYGVEFLRRDGTDSIRVHEYFVSDADNLRSGFVGIQRTRSGGILWRLNCVDERTSMLWVVAKLNAQGRPESVHIRPDGLSNRCLSAMRA